MKIDVVFAVDCSFVIPLRVALASVCVNALNRSSLRVWIASDCSEDGAEGLVQQLSCSYDLDIRWLPLDNFSILDAPVMRPWSRATYLRLLVPSALPDEIERFVYLDSDLVVERDLVELHNSELAGKPLGAVKSFLGAPRRGPIDFSKHPYFNAGVLVIDRQKWASHQITQKAIKVISAHPEALPFMDQDALNAVVAGNWSHLDWRWNQRPYVWELSHRRMGISREAMMTLRNHPYIIHFSGLAKPWKFGDDHPLGCRFAHYSKIAGLDLPRPTPENAVDVVRRATKMFVPRRGRPFVRESVIQTKHYLRKLGIFA
jgi:lipopolysaccharide biosynthesis glycosyltransferase